MLYIFLMGAKGVWVVSKIETGFKQIEHGFQDTHTLALGLVWPGVASAKMSVGLEVKRKGGFRLARTEFGAPLWF